MRHSPILFFGALFLAFLASCDKTKNWEYNLNYT